MKSRVAAVTAGALVVVGLGAGGAVAGQMITSANIKDGSVKGVDLGTDTLGRRQLRPNSVGADDLSDWVLGKVTEPADSSDGMTDYRVFTSTLDFGPGGIGGAWCGAPDANTEDEGWRVIGGGATLTPEDVDAGVAVVSSWPNTTDPLNPGWSVQLNKPANVDPGEVQLYAVCVKTDDSSEG